VNTLVVPQSAFVTPQILRKSGNISGYYNLTPNWTLYGRFFRENQNGTRPIGLIMNSSPSASATSVLRVELPKPINYCTILSLAVIEFGRRILVAQAGYTGSYFDNNIHALTWDNPFRLTDEQISNPLSGRMALYPDNHANYLNFAAGTDLTKYLHVTASISPGC